MTWEDKGEMIRLMNNRLYKEAVELFSKEQDWDDQAVTMFVFGFDLTQCNLLEPIKDRITKVQTEDFRTALRLGTVFDFVDDTRACTSFL